MVFARLHGAARLSVALVGKGFLLPVLSSALAAPVFYRSMTERMDSLSVADLLVWACNPSFGIPLLWVLLPLAVFVALAFAWRRRDNANIVVRQGACSGQWAGYALDAALLCAVAVASLVVSFMALGLLSGASFIDFNSPESRYALLMNGETLEVSFAMFVLVVGAYGFSALFTLSMVFCLLRCLFRRVVIPAALVVVAGLPNVHGQESFVYDLVRNISGGSLSVLNPLTVVYETSSIFYPSWATLGGHHLWFLVVLAAFVIVIGVALEGRREFLR